MFYFVIELVLYIVVMWALITQVIMPIAMRTKLFPSLRRERRDLGQAIVAARENIEVAYEEKVLAALEREGHIVRSTMKCEPEKKESE